MKLILFDIDGRFIDSGGAGTRSLDIASRSVFPLTDAF
jgi:phosphoglycolate phosphatase-like HAD superfamily hydrolase